MKVLITCLVVVLFAQTGNKSEKQVVLLSPPVNFPLQKPWVVPDRPVTEDAISFKMICPDCKKGDQVVPIYYGYPSSKTMEKIEQSSNGRLYHQRYYSSMALQKRPQRVLKRVLLLLCHPKPVATKRACRGLVCFYSAKSCER